MEATYLSNNSFSVVGNRTDELILNRRVKLDCGVDGIQYASIVSSTFTSVTVVIIDENVLTANLVTMLYSVIKPGVHGNIADHYHTITEGDGGYITNEEFVPWNFGTGTISGTGDIYCNDIYTSSGTVHIGGLKLSSADGEHLLVNDEELSSSGGSSDVQSFLDLNDTPTTYSGNVGMYMVSTASGIDFVSPTSTSGVREWHFGEEDPTSDVPLAAVNDYYFNSTDGNVYTRKSTDDTVFINDTFNGTELNTSVWTAHTVPNASVTVDGVLKLNNQTGNAHSGSHCYSTNSFSTSSADSVYVLQCRWLPSIADHYNAGAGPGILFCNPSATRNDGYYGQRIQSYIVLYLAQAGAFTTQRTHLRLGECNSAGTFSTLTTQAISIDETNWQDLVISINFDTGNFSVDLNDGDYKFSATISQAVLTDIGSNFVVEFTTTEYNKTNTEAFDNVVLKQLGDSPWELQSNFGRNLIDLEDTPLTYSGTENQYLQSTGSGVIWSIISDSNYTYTGESAPDVSVDSALHDLYIDSTTNTIYERTSISGSYTVSDTNICSESNTIGLENPSYTGGAFDGVTSDGSATGAWYAYVSGYQNTGWTGQDFGAGNEKVIGKYSFYMDNATSAPKTWTFEGSSTGAWSGEEDIIDTRINYEFGSTFEWVEFLFTNFSAYRYYRINVTANNGNSTYLTIREINMFEVTSDLGNNPWESVLETKDNFIELEDTPTTYSGGQYLRTTTSGIKSIDGIILTATDDSEWLLRVTTSGVIYTTAV